MHYMTSMHRSKQGLGYGSACGLEFDEIEKEIFVTEYVDKVRCERCKKSEVFKLHLQFSDIEEK